MTQQRHTRLAKGQIWKTGVAQFEVMALGRRFIHYKVTKPFGPKRVSAQVSGIEALENYLRANQAKLIPNAANN